MKKNNFKFFGVLFIVFFIISASVFPQTMLMKDKFYLGYQGSYYDSTLWNYFFPGLSGLNATFVQNYGGHYEYDNTHFDGGFRDDISSYQGNVSAFLTRWKTTFNNNAQFMEREKALRAAYGQLSDYQAEFIPPTTKPRYGYKNSEGAEYDTLVNGETIRGLFAGPPDNIGYWLIDTLYENREQINIPQDYPLSPKWEKNYYYSDVKTPGYKWFVMPRMRIDTADAFLVTPKKVCRIEIVRYDGSTDSTLKFDLLTNDFIDANGNYSGQYIDIFYHNLSLINISIRADSLNRGNTPGTDGKSSDPDSSKVDYRIYWYGQVDLWLDRVRVADEWAFYLFHPELDSLQLFPYYFEGKIKEETESGFIGSHSNFGYFYIDEYMYNSLPCIAEVNRIIQQYKPNSGLIAESNISLIGNYSGLIDTIPAETVFQRLVSSKAVTDKLFMYFSSFTFQHYHFLFKN